MRPRSCPNSSLSISSRGSAAQLSAMNGPRRAGRTRGSHGPPAPCPFRSRRGSGPARRSRRCARSARTRAASPRIARPCSWKKPAVVPIPVESSSGSRWSSSPIASTARRAGGGSSRRRRRSRARTWASPGRATPRRAPSRRPPAPSRIRPSGSSRAPPRRRTRCRLREILAEGASALREAGDVATCQALDTRSGSAGRRSRRAAGPERVIRGAMRDAARVPLRGDLGLARTQPLDQTSDVVGEVARERLHVCRERPRRGSAIARLADALRMKVPWDRRRIAPLACDARCVPPSRKRARLPPERSPSQ